MEKEFIIEVVQNCPNPACRYYKSQLELSHRSLAHLAGAPTYISDPQPSKKGKGKYDVSNLTDHIFIGNVVKVKTQN